MADANNLLIFKKRSINNELENKSSESIENISEPGSIENIKLQKTDNEKNAIFSEESKSNKYCFNHPWRYAYTICEICKQPFCLEDIVEYKNKYYCTNDIDKVSKQVYETNFIEYSKLSYISIASFFSTFFIFIYYTNTEISLLINKIITKQILISSLFNTSYLLLALSCILVFLQLVSAFLILIRLKKSYVNGIAASILSILFFAYIYLNSNAFYYIYIIISSFIAFIVILLSAKTYRRIGIEKINYEGDKNSFDYGWADVKTF